MPKPARDTGLASIRDGGRRWAEYPNNRRREIPRIVPVLGDSSRDDTFELYLSVLSDGNSIKSMSNTPVTVL